MVWRDNGHCFACGPKNPIGLHLRFEATSGGCRTRFVAGKEHQGYEGVVHGGIVSTLLDEVVVQALWAAGIPAVTAKLEVRFVQPVPVGEELEARAVLVERCGRAVKAEAALTAIDGSTLATARATCLSVSATSERRQGGARLRPPGTRPRQAEEQGSKGETAQERNARGARRGPGETVRRQGGRTAKRRNARR